MSLVAGMLAGADSIDDMDLLRHGGMDKVFTGMRAPSTLGTFLRGFTFGHVRQLDAVAARTLIAFATASTGRVRVLCRIPVAFPGGACRVAPVWTSGPGSQCQGMVCRRCIFIPGHRDAAAVVAARCVSARR